MPAMIEPLLILVAVLTLATTAMLAVLLMNRPRPTDLSPLQARFDAADRAAEQLHRLIREEIAQNRGETLVQTRHVKEDVDRALGEFREEIRKSVKELNDATLGAVGQSSQDQRKTLDSFALRLGELRESNERRLEGLRTVVEQKLREIQEDSGKRLDQMRQTVDEKLQGTLEKRLGESFRIVSERLELVHKGLGEMQTLANGVGDLKRVLTNVKTRGTWGEVQLGNLLEQVLTPGQYGKNVATVPGGAERVEYAIRLPGRGEDEGEVWLPIDAKFPHEDYQRLVEASEKADAVGVESAGKSLESRVRAAASDISTKYLSPPQTTDFGIMFLPTEALFAEIVRRPGLVEGIQRDHRVVIAGPTTLLALLNSLQMGFRTLAIQKRSSEVWEVLGAVKTEFAEFGKSLDAVRKKIDEASNKLEAAQTRTRAMNRKLKSVESVPADDAIRLLGLNDLEAAEEQDDATPRA